jgi:zinc protease
MLLKTIAFAGFFVASFAAQETSSNNVTIPLTPVKIDLSTISFKELISPQKTKVWLLANNSIPVVTVSILFADAGAKSNPKGKQGLVRLLLAMLDEGAGPYNAKQFKKFLLEHNIHLSAHSDDDNVSIGFTVPKAEVIHAFKALELIFSKLSVDSKQLQNIKDRIVLSMKQQLFQESTIAKQEMEKVLYQDHPYNNPLQDSIRDYPHISSTDIKDYIKEHFAKEKVMISVCGDIESDELLRLIDQTLKPLQEKAKDVKIDDISFPEKGSNHFVFMDIPQTFISFAHKGIPRKHKDYYPLYVALEILGSGELQTRLMKEIRIKRGLVYGIQTGFSFAKHNNFITGVASTKAESAHEVITFIKNEFEKLIKEGITDEELQKTKRHLIGSFPLKLASTSDITTRFQTIQYFDLGSDFLAKRTAMIESVTKDQVNEVIKDFFKPEQMVFVVVGKQNPFEQQEATKGDKQ